MTYREDAKPRTAKELTLRIHLQTRFVAFVMFAIPAFGGISLGLYFLGRDTPFAFGIAPVSLGVLVGLAFALPLRKPVELVMSFDGGDLIVDGGKRIPIARIASVVAWERTPNGSIAARRGEMVVVLHSLDDEEDPDDRITLSPECVYSDCVAEIERLRAFLVGHGWSGEAP